MIFSPTKLAGAYVVALDPHSDERGCFARTWCAEEFAQQGLDARLTQCNLSYSKRRGTIRGLHLQAPPHEEAKLVRDSPTFGQWLAVELTMENRLALFVPIGCAHGLQTLADDTEVLYQMTTPYVPGAARGVRWDDATLGIRWPLEVSEVSPRDRELPGFVAATKPQAELTVA
jgi:dTDP-4-dehydrorhamnose 3,5-epimerase